jgi:hypothetical protein
MNDENENVQPDVQPEAQEPVKEEPVKINVEVISAKGKTTLVKYLDGDFPRRVYIPTNKISDGKVEEHFLAKGLPYGLPWEKIKLPKITGEDFALELHRQGIWTAEDCYSNSQGKRDAIIHLYSPLSLYLTEFLREEKLKSKGGK